MRFAFGSDHALAAPPPKDRWWVPEDIAAPPTTDPITPATALFTREHIHLVLSDL